MSFDALRAAEAIVSNAAITAPRTRPVPPPAREEEVEGVVVSVIRGVIELRDTAVGGTRRLIAPPMVAESLKRSVGIVTMIIDDTDHVVRLNR
jgi:hypothetical protein